MARARGSQPPSPALAYSVIRGLVTNRLMVSPRATLSRITDLKVQPISGYRGWLVRRRRAYIFTQPKNRADLMKNVRPLLKKDFVKIIASWPIVRWTVPYGPIYFVARDLNLLDVLASGRKETHASPIYFWWRRFREPSRNSSRVAALADC